MIKTSLTHQVLESNNLPKVLVAGGAGFIGSKLCAKLLEQNCQVYCIDNLTTASFANLSQLQKQPNFYFFKHDLTQSLTPLKLPLFDYIFHLANVTSSNGRDLSLKTLLVNSSGTRQLLELAKQSKSKFLLVSTPYVFEGLISVRQLTDYFGKKEDKEGFYTLAEAKRFSESLTVEYYKQYGLDCRIVRLIDVYGPGMNLSTKNQLNYLINSANNNAKLQLANEGLAVLYPTFVADAVYGLIKAMFSADSNGKIYSLANPQAVTILNLAHLLKQLVASSLTIEFIAGEQLPIVIQEEEIKKTQTMLNWHPQTNLEEGLKQTFQWLQQKQQSIAKINDHKRVQADKVVPIDSLPRKKLHLNFSILRHLKKILVLFRFKSLIRLTVIVLLIFLLFIGLPLTGFTYFIKTAEINLKNQQYIKAASAFNNSSLILAKFNWLTSIPAVGQQLTQLKPVLNAFPYILSAQAKQEQAVTILANLMKYVFQGERGDPQEQINQLKTILNQMYQSTSIAGSELADFKLSSNWFINKNLKDKLEEFKTNSLDQRKQINLAKTTIDYLPVLLGVQDKKNYLILFQDNNEIRPTGGYISAIGLLSLEKGKIINLDIQKVTTADANLKGHINPPAPISQFLNEKNWYLRDSNWDPDFPSSAVQAKWFLTKELDKDTDGVISLNLSLIVQLLEALGPIQTADSNLTINADNFYDKLITAEEINYNNNINNKDFLVDLLNLLFVKIKNLKAEEWSKLLKIINNGLVNRQIQAYFNDNRLADFFSLENWNGAIRQQLTLPSSGLADYIMIVDSNMGINKVNYYINRSLDYNLTILPDFSLQTLLTVSYDNTSSLQGWPGGEYSNYVRVYCPALSSLTNLRVGSTKQDLKPVPANNIDKYYEHGKQVFGFFMRLPPKETKVIELSLKTAKQTLVNNNNLTYLLYWQKQSGMDKDNFQLKVNYPSNWQPYKIAPPAQTLGKQVNFKGIIDNDKVFLINFIK